MNHAITRISVGLPVYNGEEFLAKAIDSILGQTYENFELIVSDNASTDATEQICREYAAKDRRIRYERQPRNQGAAWNHNHVFELARSEYFKWVSHDDFIDATFLQRCLEILDANPQVVWCHSKSVLVDPSGQRFSGFYGRELSYADDESAGPSRLSPWPHQRFRAVVMSKSNLDVYGLIRSSVMSKTGLMIPYYGMDKVFVAELSLWGKYMEVPEVLYYGRVHAKASGSLPTARQQWEFINPQRKRRFPMTRLHLLTGHAQAVRRANLSFGERTRCRLVLVNYLLQMKKWKSVIARTLRGTGTGGGFLDAMEDQQDKEHKRSNPVAVP